MYLWRSGLYTGLDIPVKYCGKKRASSCSGICQSAIVVNQQLLFYGLREIPQFSLIKWFIIWFAIIYIIYMMPFHVEWSVLFLKTFFVSLKFLSNQPSSISVVFEAEHCMWKFVKLGLKMLYSLCTHLFEGTLAFWKIWMMRTFCPDCLLGLFAVYCQNYKLNC